MALFAGNKLYTREVTDPDDGQTYHVKLRKMDEGYRQQRSDDLMETKEDTQKKLKRLPGSKNRKRREQITSYKLGTVRLSDLSYSIKEWDFPDEDGEVAPINLRTIQGLSIEIADQIWDHIEDLNPTVFSPEDEEEEEEEYEDADEDEEAAASGNGDLPNAYAPAAAPTATTVTYGDEEGPKESAEAS